MKYDAAVIGAGPGGYEAALCCARYGMKTVIIEKDRLGGVCTNEGCIPTKTLLNCAKTFNHAANGSRYGVHCKPVFSLSDSMALKNETVETLRNGIALSLKNAGVEMIAGEAEIKKGFLVRVGENEIEARKIILATGSSPILPPVENIGSEIVLTSREMLNIDALPESAAVIGGGVVGVEFASLLSMLGVKVSVVELTDEILPMLDADLAKLVRREMKDVDFFLGCRVERVLGHGLEFSDSKGMLKHLDADMVLCAVGRRANAGCAGSLGLEMRPNGSIKVNGFMQTSDPDVYAVGDINGLSMLAHSASRMGEIAAAHICGKRTEEFNADFVPWAVYGSPEAAGCGLSERQAGERGISVRTSQVLLRSNGRFLAENGKRASGAVKVTADADSGKILGVHMVGSYASEMICAAALMIYRGLTVFDVADAVFPHPTVSEGMREACRQLAGQFTLDK